MSSSPNLRSQTPVLRSVRVTYNSAGFDESPQNASGMIDNGKQFEGQVVNGEFFLQRFLGGSDRSAVFLTERQGEPGKAAIKLIPSNPETDHLQLGRWELAAKLSHPHLVQLFDAGRCELNGVPMLYV